MGFRAGNGDSYFQDVPLGRGAGRRGRAFYQLVPADSEMTIKSAKNFYHNLRLKKTIVICDTATDSDS